MNSRPSRFPLIALFSGAAAISLAPIFVKLSDVGPVAKAFRRLFFALPFLWTGVLISAGARRKGAVSLPRSRSEYLLMAAAGLFFAADLSVWHLSLKFTTVVNATLLPNFALIFVVLGVWFLFEERVHLPFILGMALAMAGTVLMAGFSYRLNILRFCGDAMDLAAAVVSAGSCDDPRADSVPRNPGSGSGRGRPYGVAGNLYRKPRKQGVAMESGCSWGGRIRTERNG